MKASNRNKSSKRFIVSSGNPELMINTGVSPMKIEDYAHDHKAINKDCRGRLIVNEPGRMVGTYESLGARIRVGFYRVDTKTWGDYAFRAFDAVPGVTDGVELALPYHWGERRVRLDRYPAIFRVTSEHRKYVVVSGECLNDVLTTLLREGTLPKGQATSKDWFDPATGRKTTVRINVATVGVIRKGAPSVWDFELNEVVPNLVEMGDLVLPGFRSGRDTTVYRVEKIGRREIPVARIGNITTLHELYKSRGWNKLGKDVYWRPARGKAGEAGEVEVITWTDPAEYLSERTDALARHLDQAGTEALYARLGDAVRSWPRPSVWVDTNWTSADVQGDPDEVIRAVRMDVAEALRDVFEEISAPWANLVRTRRRNGVPA